MLDQIIGWVLIAVIGGVVVMVGIIILGNFFSALVGLFTAFLGLFDRQPKVH